MAFGDFPPPPGYIWNDAIGWHWAGCCCQQRSFKLFADQLAEKQEPLGKEFEEVLFDNLAELYCR